MPEQIIEIKDSEGNIIGSFPATVFPLKVTTNTMSATNKEYTLSVNYFKDPVSKVKDKTKITGMQLS